MPVDVPAIAYIPEVAYALRHGLRVLSRHMREEAAAEHHCIAVRGWQPEHDPVEHYELAQRAAALVLVAPLLCRRRSSSRGHRSTPCIDVGLELPQNGAGLWPRRMVGLVVPGHIQNGLELQQLPLKERREPRLVQLDVANVTQQRSNRRPRLNLKRLVALGRLQVQVGHEVDSHRGNVCRDWRLLDAEQQDVCA